MYSTKQFVYIPETNRFISELSDLNKCPFIQIYDDACDKGLELRSEKTGSISKWYISNTIYSTNEDHELISYELTPIKESVHKFPQLINCKMIIFND